MGYSGRKTKEYAKLVALVLAVILISIIWGAMSMTSGCPNYMSDEDDYNVRSGSRGHSRGYYHGGKY